MFNKGTCLIILLLNDETLLMKSPIVKSQWEVKGSKVMFCIQIDILEQRKM